MDNRDDVLESAVLGLFQQKGATFLSTIYCALGKQWDSSIPTACVNSKVMKINPEWFCNLTPRSRVAWLAHECWHVALMHTDPTLWTGKDHRRLNQAMDHAINLMMLDHGYHFDSPGCMDPMFSGWTTEQIYDYLIQNPRTYPDCEDVQPSSADVSGIVIGAVQAAKKANESEYLPASLLEQVDRLINPVIPWTELLRRWFNQRDASRYSYSKPNRRYHHSGLVLPTRHSTDSLDHIVFALDTSGSMSLDDLTRLNTEVLHVKETYNPKLMTLIMFDHEVRKVMEVTKNEQFRYLEMEGRGGTLLEPLWDTVKDIKAQALVVMSDMEVDIPSTPPRKGLPILWVCLGPKVPVPYGTLIQVEK